MRIQVSGARVGALTDEATQAAAHGAAQGVAKAVLAGTTPCKKVDAVWVLDNLDPAEDKALAQAFIKECDRQATLKSTLTSKLSAVKSSPWPWIAAAGGVLYLFWRYSR